jgi:chromosome segregation ATPase
MTAPTARIPAMEAAAKEAANELEYAEVQLHRALQAIQRYTAKAELQKQRAETAEGTADKRRAQTAAKTIREKLQDARAAKREAQRELKEAEEWVRQLQRLNRRAVADYERQLAETRRSFAASRHVPVQKRKGARGKGRTGLSNRARGTATPSA